MQYSDRTKIMALSALSTKGAVQVAKDMAIKYATLKYWQSRFVVEDGKLLRRRVDPPKTEESSTRAHLLAAREALLEKIASIDSVLEMFPE